MGLFSKRILENMLRRVAGKNQLLEHSLVGGCSLKNCVTAVSLFREWHQRALYLDHFFPFASDGFKRHHVVFTVHRMPDDIFPRLQDIGADVNGSVECDSPDLANT